MDLFDLAADYARRQGVDPELARRVMWYESQGDPRARSPKGAIGPMQLMPGTARMLGVNPYDPMQNVWGGVSYLRMMGEQFGGDPVRMVAAYNTGPNRIARGQYPQETRRFVQNVFGTPPWEQPEQRQPQRQPAWRRNKQTGIVELWQNGQWIAQAPKAVGAGISPTVRKGIAHDMTRGPEPEGPGVLKRAAAAGLSGLDTALDVLDIPMKPVHWAKERAIEQMMKVPALRHELGIDMPGGTPEDPYAALAGIPSGERYKAPLARWIGEVAELPLYPPVYRGVGKGIRALRHLPGLRSVPRLGAGMPHQARGLPWEGVGGELDAPAFMRGEQPWAPRAGGGYGKPVGPPPGLRRGPLAGETLTPVEQAAGATEEAVTPAGIITNLNKKYGTGAKATIEIPQVGGAPTKDVPTIILPPAGYTPKGPPAPKPAQVGLAQPGLGQPVAGQVQPPPTMGPPPVTPPPAGQPVTVKKARRIKSVGDPKATRTQAAVDKVSAAVGPVKPTPPPVTRVGKRGERVSAPSVVGDWWDKLTPMERTDMFKQEYGQIVPAGYKGMPFDLLLADYKLEIAALHRKYGKWAKTEDIDKALKSMEKPPEVRRRRPPKATEVD